MRSHAIATVVCLSACSRGVSLHLGDRSGWAPVRISVLSGSRGAGRVGLDGARCPGTLVVRSLSGCLSPEAEVAILVRVTTGLAAAETLFEMIAPQNDTIQLGEQYQGSDMIFQTEGLAGRLEDLPARGSLEVRLLPSISLSGTIVSSRGPVVGAEVEAYCIRTSARFGPARSGARGEFSIRDLPLGKYYLVATAPGFAPRLLLTESATSSVTLFLPELAPVVGVLRLPNGIRPTGARVRLRTLQHARERSVTADSGGNFRFDDAWPEEIVLEAAAGAFYGIRTLGPPPRLPSTIELAEGVAYERRAVFADGRPASGVRVVAIADDVVGPETRTDERGWFQLWTLDERSAVHLSEAGIVAQLTTLDSGRGSDIVVTPEAQAQITVVGPSRRPVEGLELDVTSEEGIHIRAVTDRFGRCTLPGLKAGRHSVRALAFCVPLVLQFPGLHILATADPTGAGCRL